MKFGIIYLLTKNTKYCHKTKTRLQILGNLVFEFNLGYVLHPMNVRSFFPSWGYEYLTIKKIVISFEYPRNYFIIRMSNLAQKTALDPCLRTSER